MTEKESKSQVSEEKGGKPVPVRRGALASAGSFEERFEQLENLMDRMMGGFSPSRWMRPFEREWPLWPGMAGFRAPSVDVIDRETEIVVRAEMPGINKDDISISVTADSIVIEGHSKKEEAEEKGSFRRREISSSSFSRSLTLPAEVDSEAAKATLKDGVLEVTLPKTAASKRKKVPID